MHIQAWILITAKCTYSKMRIDIRIRIPLCSQNGQPFPLQKLNGAETIRQQDTNRLAVVTNSTKGFRLGERILGIKQVRIKVPYYIGLW